MIIAPKGRGWTGVIHNQEQFVKDTRGEESLVDAIRRNLYWERLRKRVAQMPGVRIGK